MSTKIKPQPNNVYPTADSIDAAWLEIKSNLPITDANKAYALVMQYHNRCVLDVEKRVREEMNESNTTSRPASS